MTGSEITSDLVVVGGGLAGLTAAVRACELGLSVTVLEAGAGEDYPCNTRFSSGIFHAAYLDVTRPPEELAKAIVASGAGDPALVDVIAANAGRALDWLRGQGVGFARLPLFGRQAWMMAPLRPPVPHLEWTGRGPDAALRKLAARLVGSGGRLVRGAVARELLMDGGACRGLIAVHDGRTLRAEARHVLLADGGFAGDDELFRRFIGPAPERVLQRGAGTGRGGGVRMAEAAGAALAGMERFYGHLLSRDAMHDPGLWPYPQVDQLASAGIVVGALGERLFDEGLGGIHAANMIAALPDPLSTTAILDADAWASVGREGQVAPDPFLAKGGATVHEAANLRSLAIAAGLPPAALEATVTAYNAALAAGTSGALVPPRSERRKKARPIATPPFRAIPLCAGITNTFGGIVIDAAARALRADGRPVEGLLAAGATAAGMEGGPTTAYVGGLVKAAVFGLVAAETAGAPR